MHLLKQALAQKHDQDIFLYAAAGEPKDLYLVDELRQLAETIPQLHYHPVVRRDPGKGMLQGDLIEIVGQRHPSFKEWFIFFCGAPGVVKSLQKRCFLQGASMRRIYADRSPRIHGEGRLGAVLTDLAVGGAMHSRVAAERFIV